MLQLKNRSLLTNPTVSALLPDVLAQSKAARSVRPKLKPRRTLPAEAPQLPEPKPLKILSGPKLEAVADAPPPILLPEPRAAQSGNKAIPPSEVEYTQSLPDVTPTRRARKEFGEQPIEEFKRIAPLPEYEPLSKEKRTGFKGRAKGVWNALQNAGAAGADGTAVIGALVGGAISPDRANQVKWRRTVELPAVHRRAAEEESVIRRQKIRNETEDVETNKEKADHLFYGTDAERENNIRKLKAAALRAQEDRVSTSSEKQKDRESTQTLAEINAETSRQNNIRTTGTSRENNIRTTGTSRENNIRTMGTSRENNIRTNQTSRENNLRTIQTRKQTTSSGQPGSDLEEFTEEEIQRKMKAAEAVGMPHENRAAAIEALRKERPRKPPARSMAEGFANQYGGSWKRVPSGK